jgi:RNA-directed DNA polymerase
MHDAEKSDSPRVPRKSANNAACAAAEPIEQTDGTKGNADLQSTVRTQSRKAVSQARESRVPGAGRIREAVNRNKKEKPTVLLHQVSVDCLACGIPR